MPEISGRKHYNWKGGRILSSDGYILVKQNNHTYADKWGYVREHRFIMEEYVGRKLTSGDVVHHINGIKTDNRIKNLKLLTIRQHKSIEAKLRWKKYRKNYS